jgi:DNA-binding transcriptional MocR family regulator
MSVNAPESSDLAITRVEHAMDTIRRRIAARALTAGARLPSIRGFAAHLHVSKSTVVEAYDRLAAEGIIRSRRGSGFYVAAHMQPLLLDELGPRLERAIDPLWVSRQALEAGEDMLKPGCGWLPDDWMPQASLRRALRGLARADDTTLVGYDSPLGLPALRQILARRFAERGLEVALNQILLTDSATHAIDLLCRFLLEPGDIVLVDDPCYFNFHALLRAHRVRTVSVPQTPTGPDVAAFGQVLSEHKPRLYLTNSALHNPTGAMLSPLVAHRILKLAEEHDLTIIEDDVFADFEPEPGPRLATFDGLQRVIQVGSFSKTLSAAMRCGYIATRPDWVEGLADLAIATAYGSGRLSAEFALAVLTDGSYRKHVEQLRERLARARGQTGNRLKALGIEPWIEPQGGMFLWCRLPGERDAAGIAQAALSQNILLAPGNVFSPSQTAGSYLRFNVAQCSDERIFRMLAAAIDG